MAVFTTPVKKDRINTRIWPPAQKKEELATAKQFVFAQGRVSFLTPLFLHFNLHYLATHVFCMIPDLLQHADWIRNQIWVFDLCSHILGAQH